MKREGLSEEEARKRLEKHGPNSIPEGRGPTVWTRIAVQFASPIIWLLVAALAIDLAIWVSEGAAGFPYEAAAIGLILVLNAFLGVFQEYRADAALAKLKELAHPKATVIREGRLKHVPSRELVPGDLVRLNAGDRATADARILEAKQAMLDESMLTGESVPVDKDEGDEVHAGTQLVRGVITCEVTKTGSESALGKLASSLQALETEKTPLERKFTAFGGMVARWVVGLAVSLVVLGVLAEGIDSIGRVLLFSIALAVAAVPEGMQAVMTLTLARGVERMARKNAVVRRMSAVEALGSVTVIATDKTGTITHNKMSVRGIESDDPASALQAMVLANDAELDSATGDPLEQALLKYASEQGHSPDALRAECPRESELPFESKRKYMRVTCLREGKSERWLKGAPEVLLERSTLDQDARKHWHERAESAAGDGFRLLAFASGGSPDDEGLTFLGFAALWDPPREEVAEAVLRAREAGVRVLMVTGDHPATALAIAEAVGIPTQGVLEGNELANLEAISAEINVFARVQPEDKLKLIERLKDSGEIVAMTGDGVNDSPALKRADVAVAMGRRGTDIAREVSDLILLDDNFATIVAAIEQGRGIFANIQKFIRFLFATNLAEIVVVVGGAVGAYTLGLREPGGALLLPLTAVQLLWINVVTDGPVALALGLDRNPGVMDQPPRPPKSPMLDPFGVRFILCAGLLTSAIGLGLLAALPQFVSIEETRSALFQYIAIAQLLFAYPARSASASKRNRSLAWAVLGGIVLQIATATVPTLRSLLGLVPLSVGVIGVIALAVAASWAAAEGLIRTRWMRGPSPLARTSTRS